jgi:hypothetical protein
LVTLIKESRSILYDKMIAQMTSPFKIKRIHSYRKDT